MQFSSMNFVIYNIVLQWQKVEHTCHLNTDKGPEMEVEKLKG